MKSQIKALIIFLVTFSALFFYAKSPYGVTFAQQLLKKIDLDSFLPEKTDTTTLAVVEDLHQEPDKIGRAHV